MSNKFKITEVKSFMVDGAHKVDLSHNHDKSEWFITIKGDFYAEFTFCNPLSAEAMYEILTDCTNVFMDSLLIAEGR
jgi:hypothetical protein